MLELQCSRCHRLGGQGAEARAKVPDFEYLLPVGIPEEERPIEIGRLVLERHILCPRCAQEFEAEHKFACPNLISARRAQECIIAEHKRKKNEWVERHLANAGLSAEAPKVPRRRQEPSRKEKRRKKFRRGSNRITSWGD